MPQQASAVRPQLSVEETGTAQIPAARHARHRAPGTQRGRLRLLVFACVGAGLLSVSPVRGLPSSLAGALSARPSDAGHRAGTHGTAPRPDTFALPGVGPRFGARIPPDARQALVVVGKGPDSDLSTATLWQRQGDGRWLPGGSWPAHNALHGWVGVHYEGDLRSPIGVYTLTAAGGLDGDPGTKLPYYHSAAFKSGGTGFEGEPLTGAFDYVVAIDYNRVPGSSPLDARAPLGADRGQGLWVHVDHDGPTHGCVSLSKPHMVDLLRSLNPADHPVIVMGDHATLAE